MNRHRAVLYGIIGLTGTILFYFLKRARGNYKKDVAPTDHGVVYTAGPVGPVTTAHEGDENALSSEHVMFLNSMLDSQNIQTQNKALITIANMSTFTNNKAVFKKCNTLHKLISFVTARDILLWMNGSVPSWEVIDNALICLTNLALDEDNQSILQNVLKAIMHLLESSATPLTTKQKIFDLLINLSVLPTIHDRLNVFLPRAMNEIFEAHKDDLIENSIRLSALKFLINLSNSEVLADDILCHEIPESVYTAPISCCQFQKPDLFLRWLTLLSILLDMTPKIEKHRNEVENRMCLKSLFSEKDDRFTLNRELEKFVSQKVYIKDRQELYQIASSMQCKLNSLNTV